MEHKDKGEYGIFYGDSLYDYSHRKVPIIENILYEHDVVCISSRPGTGKSILVKQLLFNLTTGKPFLGTYEIPKACNVLYVQTEGDRSETIERVDNMKKGVEVDDTKWAHINQSGIIINSDAGINELLLMAKRPELHYDVIIIDPLYTTVRGSMLSDEVATGWVRNARKLKGVYGAAIIVLHHDHKDAYSSDGIAIDRKKDNIFGSVFWAAFFNHNFKLRKSKKGTFYFESGKQRSGKIVDCIEMKLVEPVPLMFTAFDEKTSQSVVGVRSILETVTRKMRVAAIKQQIDSSQASIYRALAKLQEARLVDKISEDGQVYYIWRR